MKFLFFYLYKEFYLADSPTNSPHSPSRGRQLWTMTVENVLEHDKTPSTSLSMVSSVVNNNLTKR